MQQPIPWAKNDKDLTLPELAERWNMSERTVLGMNARLEIESNIWNRTLFAMEYGQKCVKEDEIGPCIASDPAFQEIAPFMVRDQIAEKRICGMSPERLAFWAKSLFQGHLIEIEWQPIDDPDIVLFSLPDIQAVEAARPELYAAALEHYERHMGPMVVEVIEVVPDIQAEAMAILEKLTPRIGQTADRKAIETAKLRLEGMNNKAVASAIEATKRTVRDHIATVKKMAEKQLRRGEREALIAALSARK